MESNLNTNLYGTTLSIGMIEVDTFYGKCKVFTFVDVCFKNYVMALSFGDLNSDTFYTRMHSSCVTSESLRSLDCDCVQQLNGAIRKIAEKGGILFYLVQEGRGCGYVGKSRGLMLTQHDSKLDTFQAYAKLGMRPDYRSYHNIKEICHILGLLDKKWVLLTNNPDKINGFQNIGLKVDRIESIEFLPNAFNMNYLYSKQQFGHLLVEVKKKVKSRDPPFTPIEPFVPYALPRCQRFFYVSSYYLPIKPIQNQIICKAIEKENFLKQISSEDLKYVFIEKLDEDRYLLQLTERKLLSKYEEIFTEPYWFKVSVFYDIVSGLEYVALSYGDLEDPNKIPIVRVRSESLMDRFPLTHREYHSRYKRVLQSIVRNGSGLIVQLYQDGRGAGFGYYLINQIVSNPKDIGFNVDQRDFQGAAGIINHILNQRQIIVMSGTTSKEHLKKALDEYNIPVYEWRDIKVFETPLGHESLSDRIELLEPYIKNTISSDLSKLKLDQKEYIVSGIGSSESHAKHLCYLLNKYTSIKATFMPISTFYSHNPLDKKIPCILYSQGLSPNINICLEAYNYSNMIVITSVNEGFHKQERLETLRTLTANGSTVINYPEEYPDDTLIRVQGPTGVFGLNIKIVETITLSPIANMESLFKSLSYINVDEVDSNLLANLMKSQNVCIISSYPLNSFLGNIANKFMEGCFYPNPYITDYLSFGHGVFQCIENAKYHKTEPYVVILLVDKNSKVLAEKTKQMVGSSEYIYEHHLKLDEELMVIEAEIFFNKLIFSLIYKKNIDQANWKGKDKQHVIYEIQSAGSPKRNFKKPPQQYDLDKNSNLI
jgi:3,4-dihydroxy 2-butanone 4-phosphate synthase/GTP cyclohydrolase II